MTNKKILSACLSLSLVLSIGAFQSANAENYSFKITKNYSQLNKLVENSNYKQAEHKAFEMLKKNPNDVAALNLLGDSYKGQFKLDSAYKQYKRVLKLDPKNSTAHNGLGDIYLKRTTSSNMNLIQSTVKLYEMAIKEFKTAIKLNHDNYEAYNNLGLVYYKMGQIDNAEKAYRHALSLEPKYSEALENLGAVLFEKNQLNEAIDKYNEAVKLNPKNSSAYYHLGEALIEKGNYNAAINKLNTSLSLFRNSAPVHNSLGKAYERQGNEIAAIAEYRKAVEIKPEMIEPYVSIANIYEERGDDDFAIVELKNALAINSDFLEAKFKIAEISLANGNNTQAIKYYKDLANSSEYSNFALKGLAKAYFAEAQKSGTVAGITSATDYDQTEKAILQAIVSNPQDMQLYLALLRVSKLTNNDAKAQGYLNQIIKNTGNTAVDTVIKGEALFIDNRYNEAEVEFKKSLTSVTDLADLQYLGDILAMDKQYKVAKEAYNMVLIRDFDNAKAQKAIERIKVSEDAASAKYNVAKAFYSEGQTVAAIEGLLESISINPMVPKAQLLLAKSFEKTKYYQDALDHYSAYVNLIRTYDADYDKYKKKVAHLQAKVDRMKKHGQEVKKYRSI